jgi:5-methylthioadenosine/S-adenosylhomocysteine deaminase
MQPRRKPFDPMTEAPRPCDLMIRDALVLSMDASRRVIPDGAVAVADDRIEAVGAGADLAARFRPAETIRAAGALLLPGLVNLHNHTPLMITRGMVEDRGFAPAYTPGIPQGHVLSHQEASALSRLGVYELLRAGSTTIVDYYRHPMALAQAIADLGLRGVVGGRIHDIDMAALARGEHRHEARIGRETLDETIELMERFGDHPSGRLRCDLAPHAPDTCSLELLRQVAAVRKGGQVHTHLAQSREEVAYVTARDGLSPVDMLDTAGLLDPNLVAAHCIHLDEAGVQRAGAAGINVAHAPIGNARAGDSAPILELEAAGARIALCTDTMSADLFEAMRMAIASARMRAGGRIGELAIDAAKALHWATANGAAALGLGDEIGAIEVGKKADLVLLDGAAPNLTPVIDGYGIVVHGASGLNVDSVVVDGKVLLRGGRPVGFDGAAIVAEAQAVAESLWRRYGTVPVTGTD